LTTYNMPAEAADGFIAVGKSVPQDPRMLSYLLYYRRLGVELRSGFDKEIIKRLEVFNTFGEPRDTCQSTQNVTLGH